MTVVADTISKNIIESEHFPIKSENDGRDYKVIILKNGLRCTLVSDPEAPKSASYMAVESGSFNDPATRPGLAHFLEHMLFLGTEKYPDPDEFDGYINKMGGGCNAFTSSNLTVYYYNVLPDALSHSLDMFAQFFIAPKFAADYVEREVNAIDSEFKSGLLNDNRRAYAVEKETCNPLHPLHRFNIGNSDTLADNESSLVRDDLIEFFNTNYSADKMNLVLVGPQSIEELSELAINNFSSIKSKPLSAPKAKVPAFSQNEVKKLLQIKSITNIQQLILSFPVPHSSDEYLNHPKLLIADLLLQTNEGSLYSILKDKGYINYVDSYSYMVDPNQDMFNIDIELTDLGMENKDEIIQITFSYLNFLRSLVNSPDLANYYNALKQSDIRDFTHESKISSAHLGRTLIEYDKLKIDPKDILVADYFQEKSTLDIREITSILELLRPDNLRLKVVSPNLPTDKVEKIYGTSYSYTDLEPALLAKWNEALDTSSFAFSFATDIAPENLKVHTLFNVETPVNVTSDPRYETWYKSDIKYQMPKLSSNYQFHLPDAAATPENTMMVLLLNAALLDYLIPLDSAICLAGANCSVGANALGINLRVGSYTDKADNLLKLILQTMINGKPKEEHFANHKQEIKRSLQSSAKDLLYKRGVDSLNVILKKDEHDTDALLAALEKIEFEQFEKFSAEFFSKVDVKTLFAGNIAASDARRLSGILPQLMPLAADTNPVESNLHCKVLPTGKICNYTLPTSTTDSTTDDNNLCILFYQSDDDIANCVRNILLKMLVSRRFNDELRTNQQLGYVVCVGEKLDYNLSGIIFLIQSVKIDSAAIKERIEEFLLDYREELADMDIADFNEYKNSLQSLLLQEPPNLFSDASYYWTRILDSTYSFDRREKLSAILDEITIDDMVSHLQKITGPGVKCLAVTSKELPELNGVHPIKDVAGFKNTGELITNKVTRYMADEPKPPLLFNLTNSKQMNLTLDDTVNESKQGAKLD